MNRETHSRNQTGQIVRHVPNTRLHGCQRDILAESVNTLMTAFDTAKEVPIDGLVLYSERLGNSPHYFYNLQILLSSSRSYLLASAHSSGHSHVCCDAPHQRLEAAVLALLQYKRDYHEGADDDRAEACAVHNETMRMESYGATR